jgi:hypothetical protein
MEIILNGEQPTLTAVQDVTDACYFVVGGKVYTLYCVAEKTTATTAAELLSEIEAADWKRIEAERNEPPYADHDREQEDADAWANSL